MRDILPVYFKWLNDVDRQDSTSDLFNLWAYSLTDNQLDEIARKYPHPTEQEANIISNNRGTGGLNIAKMVRAIKEDRIEHSILLGDSNLSAPIDDPIYYKLLLEAHGNREIWNKATLEQLEKATVFYNFIDSIYESFSVPAFSQEIATMCKNLIAERWLL